MGHLVSIAVMPAERQPITLCYWWK